MVDYIADDQTCCSTISYLQRPRVDRGRSRISVTSCESQCTSALFSQCSTPRDIATVREAVGSIEFNIGIVRNVARDRTGAASGSDPKRSRADSRAATMSIVPRECEKSTTELGDRPGAADGVVVGQAT